MTYRNALIAMIIHSYLCTDFESVFPLFLSGVLIRNNLKLLCYFCVSILTYNIGSTLRLHFNF